MYESYYGLRERPFDLTPNARFLYFAERHREALCNLIYGICAHKGITLLIGEAGTGKTTLVRAAIAAVREKSIQTVCVNNPVMTRAEFFEFLANGFGLSREAASSKARFLLDLQRLVLERHHANGVTALIIDEAQSLPDDLLEEVRLLANLETNTEKLLPVVLAGQPELVDRLNAPALRQLKQRVALRCSLMPFDLEGTTSYIQQRIKIAGGDAGLVFTPDAIGAIHHESGGVPRMISAICDNALIAGFAAQERPVGRATVMTICREFDLAPRDGERPVEQREERDDHPRPGVPALDTLRAERTAREPKEPPAPDRWERESLAGFRSSRRVNGTPRALDHSDEAEADLAKAGRMFLEKPGTNLLMEERDACWPEASGGDGKLFASFTRRRRFLFL